MESFNHPFGKEACKKRLLEEYRRYGKLIVAFDYDNTIYDYYHKGGNYSEVINLLKKCAKLGFELVLFTCEEDETCLQNKVDLCEDLLKTGISLKSSIFSRSDKPYYNILLDDRAGLEESYEILKYVVDEIIKLN